MPICDQCYQDVEENLSQCPYCGAKINSEVLDTEVVDSYEGSNVEQNYASFMQALDPELKKALTYRQLQVATRKVIIVSALLFFTSPLAIFLSLVAIYSGINLLLKPEPFKQILSYMPNTTYEVEKKQVIKNLFINLLLLVLSVFIAYYIFYWKNI